MNDKDDFQIDPNGVFIDFNDDEFISDRPIDEIDSILNASKAEVFITADKTINEIIVETKTPSPTPVINVGFNENSMEWTSEYLEILRLCRNRAYHKVNLKRRQHLPASLSAFLLREWNSIRPQDKFSARYLLSIYSQNFEVPSSGTQSVGRKRGPQKKRKVIEPKESIPTKETDETNYDHSDKQWSQSMLDSLIVCGTKADELIKNGSTEDYSTLLHKEWINIYPVSTLSARNLKSRLTVYQRTRLEAPPPSRWRKNETNVVSAPSKSKKRKVEETEDMFCLTPINEIQTDTVDTYPRDLCQDLNDEFVPEQTMKDNIEVEPTPVIESTDLDLLDHNQRCPKHWIHVFQHKDKDLECKLTQQLLKIREELKSVFPGPDIYYVKKPKGFSAQALREWKKIYPNTKENIKSISVRFSKYDRGPNRSTNATSIERDDEGRIVWTPSLLNNLQKSRIYAEKKAGTNASSHMLTRKWKEEWKRLYPTLTWDWQSIVYRYKLHFGNDQENENKQRNKNETDDFVNAEDKVKGFRNWTTKMKEDLLNISKEIREENLNIKIDASDFSKVLLARFQKKYPNCMESSRSILSKLQSFEKLEPQTATSNLQEIEEKENDKEFTVSQNETDNRKNESSTNGNSFEEKINQETNCNDSQLNTNGHLPHSNETYKEKGQFEIEGFGDWSLVTIRDFIACMDSTRRKFATLKDQDPDGNIKLVPLLLEEWKKTHPATKDTVKSFQIKIKYLKQQKDLIKSHLSQTGLVPSDGNTSTPKPPPPPPIKTAKRTQPLKVPPQKQVVTRPVKTLGEFRWNKDMMDDVIKARKSALFLKDEALANGKKLSFHLLWEEEFRKIYPNSPFTSNNLSVHFWTWRKKQQLLGKVDPLYDQEKSLADTSLPQPTVCSLPSSPGWSTKLKTDLLEIGVKVQNILSSPDTPNEVKLQGFSSVLHTEWKKSHPERNDSIRGLNMLYSKLKKYAEDNYGTANLLKSSLSSPIEFWKPFMNQQLRKLLLRYMTRGVFTWSKFNLRSIIKEWRKIFPYSKITDFKLESRIADLVDNIETKERKSKQRRQSQNSKVSQENIKDFEWDKQAIKDLLVCYKKWFERKEDGSCFNFPKEMSVSVHEEFLKLHPNCKMTDSILMSKLYYFRMQLRKGCLDLQGTVDPVFKDFPVENKTKTRSQSSDEKPAPCSKDIIFRTWSKEMIENLIKTKKMAIAKKQKLTQEGRSDVQILDLWYEEFMNLHPEYSSTKKNLMQKYKWYRSRVKKLGVTSDKNLASEIGSSSIGALPSDIKVKNIRKDLFNHIKSVMEESRIFVPTRLPKEPEVNYDIASLSTNCQFKLSDDNTLIVPASFDSKNDIKTVSEALANLQQNNEVTIDQGKPIKTEEDTKDESIKLPGGATLVAVTEENVESILKPKSVEKPHVTITIGDSMKISSTPNLTITSKTELNTNSVSLLPVSNNSNTPPPLPVLQNANNPPDVALLPIIKTEEPETINEKEIKYSIQPKTLFIPTKVKNKLDESGMNELEFFNLLKIFDKSRKDYIETLKMGFISFFPYVIGSNWRESYPDKLIPGRKLVSIVMLYIEEVTKGNSITPEYLSKKPCNFIITENLLKNIVILRTQIERELNTEESSPVFINVELCKRWNKMHPNQKMTSKQLISIFKILNHDNSTAHWKPPEVECLLANMWSCFEKSIPTTTNLDWELDSSIILENEDLLSNELELDNGTLSLSQIQEFLISTQYLPKPNKISRPRMATKCLRLFWSNTKMSDLDECVKAAYQNYKNQKGSLDSRKSFNDMIYDQWISVYPNSKASKNQVIGRYIRNLRLAKRDRRKTLEKSLDVWKNTVEEFSKSEDSSTCVVESKASDVEYDNVELVNTLKLRNKCFSNDEDVISFIGDLQKQGKNTFGLNWPADVIRDLMLARSRARKRKRDWEDWATKKYGGVGFAYSNPNIKYAKVDDMFKEEWAKLRPEMASLSIWTLVAYGRKFDNLKKNLQQQTQSSTSDRNTRFVEHDLTVQSTVYFENSSIPKFDLNILENIEDTDEEFKELLITRQLAKIKQIEENSKYILHYLWELEWRNRNPNESINGYKLQTKLYKLEQNSELLNTVKPALIRQNTSKKSMPIGNDLEKPLILPRNNIYPENNNNDSPYNFTCYQNIKKKGRPEQIVYRLHKDSFSYNQLNLNVPAVEKVSENRLIQANRVWEGVDDDQELVDAKELHIWRDRYPAKSHYNPVKQAVTIQEIEECLQNPSKLNIPSESNVSVDKIYNINNIAYLLAISKDQP